MHAEVTKLRLYVMRFAYLLNFVLLGADVWPSLFQHQGPWDPMKAVAISFWAALSALSGLGIRYPLKMLPLLLMQMFYKVVWLFIVGVPQWSTVHSTGLGHAMTIGIVVDVIVIPWVYFFRNYALAKGERWR